MAESQLYDLESQSTWGIIIINVCARFENNLSSVFLTIIYMVDGGRLQN